MLISSEKLSYRRNKSTDENVELFVHCWSLTKVVKGCIPLVKQTIIVVIKGKKTSRNNEEISNKYY
jgi:hypothetical protein